MGYAEKTVQNRYKEFTCRQCGIIRRISKSKILKNKTLIRKLDRLKPNTSNCKAHCWKLSKNDIPFAFFSCILCGKGVMFPTESKERLDLIMDLVEQDHRLKNLKEDRILCRDLERFFHFNANKEVEIGDYLNELKKRYGDDSTILKRSIKRVSIICKILSTKGYIEPINEKTKDLWKRSYIRNETICIE